MYYSQAAETPEKYEAAAKLYGQIAAAAKPGGWNEDKIKAAYRLAKIHEKTGNQEDALREYGDIFYSYQLRLGEKKVPDWLYFVRSARDMAAIYIGRDKTDQKNRDVLRRICGRLDDSGIPEAAAAAVMIRAEAGL